MKNTELMKKISNVASKAGFQLKKRSPEILIVAGTIGVVASTIMACKATLKVNEVIDETKENIDEIHKATETGVTKAGKEYTVEDSKKDLTLVYLQTGWKLTKLYAPSVALGCMSISSIVTSNQILRKRNVALAAAYATVDKTFKEYRGRVVERFGEQLDRELRYNIKAQEIEETVVDGKGKEKQVKKTVEVADPRLNSDYARFFDSSSKEWEKDPEYNLWFLRNQQAHANDLLRARGHLFLNEVYDMLGMQRSRAGAVVGWVYNPEATDDDDTDNFVDFGIYDMYRDKCRDFVNGFEPVILLDFNVDGIIYDKI